MSTTSPVAENVATVKGEGVCPAGGGVGGTHVPSDSAGGPISEQTPDVEKLSTKDLKKFLLSQGRSVGGCFERSDFLERAKELPSEALAQFLQQRLLSSTDEPNAKCPHFDNATLSALRALQRPLPVDESVRRIMQAGGVKALRQFLKSQGHDVRGFVEASDFEAKAKAVLAEEKQAQNGTAPTSARRNLARVRYDIAAALRDCPNFYDDGSYIPLMIRFAWHCCGTYDKATGTGGSNGCTMRFPAEQADPENAGLAKAREVIAGVHKKHPWLSLADLNILAGYVAIEEAGGPPIPFSYGRLDFTDDEARAVYGVGKCPFASKDGSLNPHGSRLPAADLGPDPSVPASADPAKREAPTINAVRGTFHRMGFDDKETVALILLGHQFGRCHLENSGFVGSWYGFDPAHWNIYGPGGLGYLSLYGYLGRMKETINARGNRQWNAQGFGGSDDNPAFMMLAVDMALDWDPTYRQHVAYYNTHRLEFRRDAAHAWKKLTELGCPPGLLTPERNAVPMCSCHDRTPCPKCRPSVR